MATTGVIANVYRKKLGDLATGQVVDPAKMQLVGGKFRIGCRGWVQQGGQKVPKAPAPELTDLEANTPPVAAETPGSDYWFEKTLTNMEVSDDNTGVTEVVCALGLLDGNGQNGAGTNSTFFELAVYDQNGDIVAYCTLDATFKDPTIQIQKIVTITR